MAKPDNDESASSAPEVAPAETTLSLSGPGTKRRFFFLSVWVSVVLATLVLTRAVLLPFFLAIVVAYVFSPIVEWLEKRKIGGRIIPRWIAVLALYITLLVWLAGFVAVGVPRLAVEVEKLAQEVPEMVAQARDEWVPTVEDWIRDAMRDSTDEDVPSVDSASDPEPGEAGTADQTADDIAAALAIAETERESIRIRPSPDGDGYTIDLPEHGIVVRPEKHGYRITSRRVDAEENADLTAVLSDSLTAMASDTRATASTVLHTAQTLIRSVVKGVFTFFIMLMLSAYMLITSDRIMRFLRSLWPARRRRSFDRLVLRVDKGLTGVVRGQLLIALVNGLLSGIGFYALELRYWPILTVMATLLSVIPIFGAILSTIPACLIAFDNGMSTVFFTLLWIVIIHQIEANILNPKIMGDAAKVHPVLVIFALLAGESLFGIAGALLAVPVLSIVQSLFLHSKEVVLGVQLDPSPQSD